MVTHTRIQELTNNSEIENSRNKSHAKISEFTVMKNNINRKRFHFKMAKTGFDSFFNVLSENHSVENSPWGVGGGEGGIGS